MGVTREKPKISIAGKESAIWKKSSEKKGWSKKTGKKKTQTANWADRKRGSEIQSDQGKKEINQRRKGTRPGRETFKP